MGARIRKLASAAEGWLPPVSDCKLAYVVRGADLLYVAKRCRDGETICVKVDKADAKHEAEKLGYFLTN